LTTKIHLAVDTRCRPISRITTAGHRHDCLAFESVMAGIRIRRRGRGRPRTRPARVLGDKAYSKPSDPLPPATTPDQDHHPRAGQSTNQPSPSRRQGRTATTVRRRDLKQRKVVERCINRLKGYRAVASRYDKRDYMYRGTVDIASIRIWLRDPAS
jgi:transposase